MPSLKEESLEEKKYIWSASELAGMVAIIVALSYIYGLIEISIYLSTLSLGWGITQVETTACAMIGGLSLSLFFLSLTTGIHILESLNSFRAALSINFALIALCATVNLINTLGKQINPDAYYSLITEHRILSYTPLLVLTGLAASSTIYLLINSKKSKTPYILSSIAVAYFLIFGGAVNQGRILAYNALILGENYLAKVESGENKDWLLALTLGQNGAFILPNPTEKTVSAKFLKMEGLHLKQRLNKDIPSDMPWHTEIQPATPSIP